MKKLFYLFMLAVAIPLMFMQCSSDDNDDSNKKQPDPDPIQPGDFDPDDFVTFREVASFDTTFKFQAPAANMSCTVNFSDKWDSEECFLIKLSKVAQQNLLDKAKEKSGKDEALYITDVHCWPAETAQYAAVILKGKQTNFEQVTLGQFSNQLVTGTDWKRLILPLEEKAVKMNATEDLFVGVHAKNVAPNTYPATCVHSDSRFPGLDATYPSYGYCPNSELYLQELNDPNEDRWAWDPGKGTINFCLKVRICTLKEFN